MDWALHDVTRMYVMDENGDNDDSSVDSRTMITFNLSIQRAGERWVHQTSDEINLLVVLSDDTVRDLYLCIVLKFLRDLLLVTPSDDAMRLPWWS